MAVLNASVPLLILHYPRLSCVGALFRLSPVSTIISHSPHPVSLGNTAPYLYTYCGSLVGWSIS